MEPDSFQELFFKSEGLGVEKPEPVVREEIPAAFVPPPEKSRGGRPKGAKNKPKYPWLAHPPEPPPPAPEPVIDPEPLPPPPSAKRAAPVTTLEGQTQWYIDVLHSDAPLKDKREAMREIADLHGLKKIKDFSNLQAKSTEDLHKLLREVLEIWKTVGVLTVVDAGDGNTFLHN